jgi:hypothetical protein
VAGAVVVALVGSVAIGQARTLAGRSRNIPATLGIFQTSSRILPAGFARLSLWAVFHRLHNHMRPWYCRIL